MLNSKHYDLHLQMTLCIKKLLMGCHLDACQGRRLYTS